MYDIAYYEIHFSFKCIALLSKEKISKAKAEDYDSCSYLKPYHLVLNASQRL